MDNLDKNSYIYTKLEELRLNLDSQYLKVKDFIEVNPHIVKQRLLIKDSNRSIFSILDEWKTYSKDEQIEAARWIIIDLTDYIKISADYNAELTRINSDLSNKLFFLDQKYKESDLKISANLNEINNQVALFTVEISKLKITNWEKDRMIISLNKIIEKKKNESDNLLSRLEKTKTRNLWLKEELEEIQSLETHIKAFNLTRLLNELDRYKSNYLDASKLKGQITELQTINQNLVTSNKKLTWIINGRVAEIFGRLENIPNKGDIQDTINLLETMLSDSNDKNSDIKKKLSEKDRENSEKDLRIQELERRLSEANKINSIQQESLDAIVWVIKMAENNWNKSILVKEINNSIKPANNSLSIHPSNAARTYEWNDEHHKKITTQASKLEELVANQSK